MSLKKKLGARVPHSAVWVTDAPELCCVLTYNLQLEEIEKFCTNHVGPLLVSQIKMSEIYNYFFGKLASLNKNLKKIMAL